MNTKTRLAILTAVLAAIVGGALIFAQPAAPTAARPSGPCDIYAAAKAPCAAAHSTTRALYASYNGPLYQVLRQSDSKTLDIGLIPGGIANAAAQDTFCANTTCWITTIYDQSPKHNHLIQAPRGGFSGPAMGGYNNLPLADAAPVTLSGHKVYGVFIAPGMGLRQNDAHGTAVDDQAEGQYWVINGHHYNSGCCFDYGNAEIDSRDDDNGTMETTYYGNATAWYRGQGPGPWVMTDQENNLVGCVTTDGTKNCPTVPTINWRFVTAMAKGEPHHWASLGGDAQRGPLKVMFDGPRIDVTYDPMRKQGAILLGNGGDNSVGSQGTFYEGAMTAAGTYPSNATDELIQANVVAAKYDVQRLALAPTSATSAPPGLQTFAPGTSQETTVSFTNTSDAPATGVQLSLSLPRQWTAATTDSGKAVAMIAEPVAPGATVRATFKVTSGPAAFNGDIVARAQWTNQATGAKLSETSAEKVRNVSGVKINEFRASAGLPDNPTDSFIELYNAGAKEVDLSNWSLTHHAGQLPWFSSLRIPAGTRLAPKGFYLFGLANSGLAVQAKAGDKTLYVRSTAGLKPGDTITIDTGAAAETRKIASVGTAAATPTTLWQPVPDDLAMKIPVGSVSVPVTSVADFKVGEKVALGYGASFPSVAGTAEKYEIATVTEVGKPGTQAYLGVDAPAGAANLKVTSVANITVGDKIRLDIDSVGHGVETVQVTHVGTPSVRGALSAATAAGATSLKVQIRGQNPALTVGDKLSVGTPANVETVTIASVGAAAPDGLPVTVSPALTRAHLAREFVVAQGTGLDLAAPLRFTHAANLPFAASGTGIRFKPETAFVHMSNEPVLALGSGITLDAPLTRNHATDAVVRGTSVTNAGYQGTVPPNQWFGGPAISPQAGSMILRDAAGLVVDSVNYGLLVEPWASEGYQGVSGAGQTGCHAPATGGGRGGGGFFGFQAAPTVQPHRSVGRVTDGGDTDSNCKDFRMQAATLLSAAAAPGATNIKVASVADFVAGGNVIIDSGANQEMAVIASVGTAGATTAVAPAEAGATVIRVASPAGFTPGQTITIDQETAVIASAAFGGRGGRGGPGGAALTLSAPLKSAHAAGAQVSGSGITLNSALTKAHASGAQVGNFLPTPGAPNQYAKN